VICALDIAGYDVHAETPMTARDWKQIEAELDGLMPATTEAEGRPTPEQSSQPSVQWLDEDSILKHITDALQLDDVEQP
jgi:hypothetical protein